MNQTFIQLATVLGLSSIFGFVADKFKLPILLAFLLAGVVISTTNLFNFDTSQILAFLPEIGIAFVLFLVGMELDLRELKMLGRPILASSLGQIVISTLFGFSVATLLGFGELESLFLGLGLSFSSTVVVIKLLLEKRDLTSLYGKLSVGILLVEDLVAVLALMGVSVGSSIFHTGIQASFPVLALFLKGAALFLTTFVLSKLVLERVFRAVASSTELLFLTALTWCFLFISLSTMLGFSVVVGAFLAGVALASSPYHFQIQGKIKPLRDFFLTLFFVYLGSQVKIGDIATFWPAILTLSAYALVMKPVIFLLVLGSFGFRKHTLFQTALNLSQISEFSLVLVLFGVGLGRVAPEALSVMAAVAVLSIAASSIMITYSQKVYRLILPILSFFERTTQVHFLESKVNGGAADHVVVIGAHRLGGPVVTYLKSKKIPTVVLDFNPHIVEQLGKEGVRAIYGDVGNPDVLDSLYLERAKLIISTAQDKEDNLLFLREIKRRKVYVPTVVRAADLSEVEMLYQAGADRVILPEVLSGDYLAQLIKDHWPDVSFLKDYGKRKMKEGGR